MRHLAIVLFLLGSIAGSALSAESAQQPTAASAASPVFARPKAVTHPYLPLASLEQDVLTGTDGARMLRLVRTTRPDLQKRFPVAGQTVEPLVLESRTYVDGKLARVSVEYLAQAVNGSVHALGEEVAEYVDDQVVGHAGSWLLAANARIPRLVMPAKPGVGDKLQPAESPKIPQERDEVVSLSEQVTVPAGTFPNCVKIRGVRADGKVGYRYYAQGVGCVKETWDQGELLLASRTTRMPTQAGAPAGGKQVADPRARAALRLVGADPRAEQYWLGAINNPGLSAHERQDLIEDLNEEGFSDPKHPGPADLPLILNRIRLIETLAPHAMDQVNYNAFREAHKDLTNMARSLSGQAAPK